MVDSNTTEEIRKRNREVVYKYMTCRGEDRLQRHSLFVEDGTGGLYSTETGESIVIRGRDRLGEHAKWSLKAFPDWQWTNVKIFGTDDPNFFWVECDGKGLIRYPGYPDGEYTNHFMHSFEFQDGLIVRQREFMNPCNQFRALGIPVPTIQRGNIPR